MTLSWACIIFNDIQLELFDLCSPVKAKSCSLSTVGISARFLRTFFFPVAIFIVRLHVANMFQTNNVYLSFDINIACFSQTLIIVITYITIDMQNAIGVNDEDNYVQEDARKDGFKKKHSYNNIFQFIESLLFESFFI